MGGACGTCGYRSVVDAPEGKRPMECLGVDWRIILTLRRLTTYIYTSYRTANLQTLHFIYLVNKYTY
jgi:hypothetical protein